MFEFKINNRSWTIEEKSQSEKWTDRKVSERPCAGEQGKDVERIYAEGGAGTDPGKLV